jgi:squalene-associated FAD-dependent desaturase
VLSGNHAVHNYVGRIGAAGALQGPDHAAVDFVDLAADLRWRVALNDSILPWWVLSARRRVPGTRASDYSAYAPLLWAPRKATIADVVKHDGLLWRRLVQPYLLAALNTQPEEGSAVLAAAVLRQGLMAGGRACRPRIAHPTLAAAFVDPALKYLHDKGAQVHLSTRLRRITLTDRAALALDVPDATLPVGLHDTVILAVPPWVAADLLPSLTVPDDFRAIVNAHFRMAAPPGAPPMLGVIGGTAEWIFAFADRISVTVSGADAIVDEDRETLAARIWGDVRRALRIDAAMPAWQIVKEKRATFAATPAQDARRPGARTRWKNLFLAGDWTQTGLPATIEGAIRSGETAAALAARRLRL